MTTYREKLDNFHNFWFANSQNWFANNKSFDKKICHLYADLYHPEKLTTFHYMLVDSFYSPPLKTIISCILVCDQLVRHMERLKIISILEVEEATRLACKFTEYMYDYNLLWERTPEEQCFILLPWRHSGDVDNMITSVKIIKEYQKTMKIPIYRRFIQASLRKITKYNTLEYLSEPVVNTKYNRNLFSILDKNRCFKSLHPVDFADKQEIIMKTIENFIQKYNFSKIIVSLSGGVDSMVLLYSLIQYREEYNLDIQAIHINYNNRSTSDSEAELCSYFCALFQVQCYVRKIHEITRNEYVTKQDRAFYEEITKDIRFHCYELLYGDVFLGHNKDDVLENVLENIIRGQNFDNLHGMQETHYDRTHIFRPFLGITKHEIYEFAETYKIPFVYDSTPAWSDRGKKRDTLIPFLNNFDHRITSGLLELSGHVNNMSKIYESFVKSKITLHVEKLESFNASNDSLLATIDKSIIEFEVKEWNACMLTLCNNYGIKYISHKALRSSFQKIKDLNTTHKITLNEKLTIKIEDNINIYYKR